MKKIFVVFSLFLMTVFLHAQQPVGHWSLIPRAGVSIANISGHKIYYEDGSKTTAWLDSKYNARFAGGFDVDYQVLPTTSLSLGAFYVQQGCRTPDMDVKNQETILDGMENTRTKLDYIQFPLMVNQYLADGLAVKVGVQVGLLTRAKLTYDETVFSKDKDGKLELQSRTSHTDDLKWMLHSYDISIPIGLSYEYQHVILDARYNLGLHQLCKEKDMPKEKNKFFTVTIGYRLF